MLNLDTNVVLAFVEDDLRSDERHEMEADPSWGISPMVMWEIAKLGSVGRIGVRFDDPGLTAVFNRLIIWPITHTIARATLRLDFSSDPADEIIAATSLVHGAPLLTRDHRILRSNITPLAIR